MIIDAEAHPGTRDNVLEDAYNLAVATRAVVRFRFNAEVAEVEPQGFATFYADNAVTARFQRIQQWMIRPGTRTGEWHPTPNSANG